MLFKNLLPGQNFKFSISSAVVWTKINQIVPKYYPKNIYRIYNKIDGSKGVHFDFESKNDKEVILIS